MEQEGFWIACPFSLTIGKDRAVSRTRSRPRSSPLFFACWAAGLSLLFVWLTAAQAAPSQSESGKKYLSVLIQIYAEVKEMGPYPGEDFIRREFFVGEDDDDTNKDVHIMILIQPSDSKEMMTVRVTEMVKDPANPQVRLAASSRMLSCFVAGSRVEIQSSDYKDKDLDKLAPEMLTAIQSKKKLLKVSLCESGPPG
jgi:hypothetical protein